MRNEGCAIREREMTELSGKGTWAMKNSGSEKGPKGVKGGKTFKD